VQLPELTFYDDPVPADPREIEEAERQLGCQFPVEVRAALLRWNGGSPEQDELPVTHVPTGCNAGRLYSVAEIVEETQDLRELDIPDYMIVLSDNGGGNHLCAVVANNEHDRPIGSIWYWVHHIADWTLGPDSPPEAPDGFYLVAPNWIDFLSRLEFVG
jgi:hypothetical protein